MYQHRIWCAFPPFLPSSALLPSFFFFLFSSFLCVFFIFMPDVFSYLVKWLSPTFPFFFSSFSSVFSYFYIHGIISFLALLYSFPSLFLYHVFFTCSYFLRIFIFILYFLLFFIYVSFCAMSSFSPWWTDSLSYLIFLSLFSIFSYLILRVFFHWWTDCVSFFPILLFSGSLKFPIR